MKTLLRAVALIIAPALACAAEPEFFRDARFYCACIVTRPDDIGYRLQDSFYVTFSRQSGQAVLLSEHYPDNATMGFTTFGPSIRFSGDCGSRGRGFASFGLTSFSFVDACNELAYSCWGFRTRKRPPQ